MPGYPKRANGGRESSSNLKVRLGTSGYSQRMSLLGQRGGRPKKYPISTEETKGGKQRI